IVAFTNDARLVLPMTSARHRGLIESAIHPLQPEGGTNVQAGLRMGYEAALAVRVVNSRGRPGLPAGSPEHAEQLARLQAEGFDVARPLPLGDGQGPVKTLDEWLWGPG
ncbi:MAG: hypothetical protein ACO213_11005, partial [Steroidobacteraceae bacterium]